MANMDAPRVDVVPEAGPAIDVLFALDLAVDIPIGIVGLQIAAKAITVQRNHGIGEGAEQVCLIGATAELRVRAGRAEFARRPVRTRFPSVLWIELKLGQSAVEHGQFAGVRTDRQRPVGGA